LKQGAAFVLVSGLLIAVAGLAVSLVFDGEAERRAIAISAAVAVGVQVVAYAVARSMARRNVIAGWGMGAVLRFVALAIFALVVVQRLGLPSSAATISLALFLFVSTLVEPFFLKT
jgi:hypothetical protein